jgi:hypothetical protein
LIRLMKNGETSRIKPVFSRANKRNEAFMQNTS